MHTRRKLLAISRVTRRNKETVKDSLAKPVRKTLRELIHNKIEDSSYYNGHDTGYTLGELYKEFPNYNPRTIRQEVSSLKALKEIEGSKCRCNAATVYHGNCSRCRNSKEGECREHHHTTKSCLEGCWCLR